MIRQGSLAGAAYLRRVCALEIRVIVLLTDARHSAKINAVNKDKGIDRGCAFYQYGFGCGRHRRRIRKGESAERESCLMILTLGIQLRAV